MPVKPKTLAEWLRQQLDRKSYRSERELARRIGVSPDTINRIGSGEPPGLGTLDKLAQWAGVPVAELIALTPRKGRGVRAPGMRLPVYVRASAGVPVGPPAGYQPFEPPDGPDEGDRWLCCAVADDGLAPRIEAGDRIIIDRYAEPADGDTVVVDRGGALVARVVALRDGRIALEADGGDAGPDGELIVVGVAHQVVKRIERRRR